MFSPKLETRPYFSFFGLYGTLPASFSERIFHINPKILEVLDDTFLKDLTEWFENFQIKKIYSIINEFINLKMKKISTYRIVKIDKNCSKLNQKISDIFLGKYIIQTY